MRASEGTAARSAGDILLENAPKRPTVRIPRDTELIVMFARPPGAVPGPVLSGPQPVRAGPGVPAIRNQGAGGG